MIQNIFLIKDPDPTFQNYCFQPGEKFCLDNFTVNILRKQEQQYTKNLFWAILALNLISSQFYLGERNEILC